MAAALPDHWPGMRRALRSSTSTGGCGEHSDALPIDAPGYVPWWPRPDVKLFNIMVQIVGETNRHAGHADILREQLDGRVGESEQGSAAFQEYDADYWASKQAKIEQAAIAADPAQA